MATSPWHYSSSDSEPVSDEDNHPEKLPRWERVAEKPLKRRKKGKRAPKDYKYEPIVHNPGPDHKDPLEGLSPRSVEKYWKKGKRAEEKELKAWERAAEKQERLAAKRRREEWEDARRQENAAEAARAEEASRAAEWRAALEMRQAK